MKNYYEILEVDKNASQEVIEKAYRALAKKYHPDLQQGQAKIESAEKMKIINAAYDILSDTNKRAQYNEELKSKELENQTMTREQQERIIQENYNLKQQLNNRGNTAYQPQQPIDEGTLMNLGRMLNEQIRAAQEQAYYDAYIQDLQNRGYRIRYKHGLKYYFKLIIALLITAIVMFLIYQIPFVKNFFIELYKENVLFAAIVDIFKNTFSVKF